MYIYNFNFIYNRLFNYTCTENIYNIKSIYKNPKYIYMYFFGKSLYSNSRNFFN